MASDADLINDDNIPLSLLTRALITSEQIGVALNEVDLAIRTTVNPVRIWLNRVLTEILYFDTIEELSKTLRGLSILGVIIYIPRVIQDLYYIIQALVKDYEEKKEFDLDAALLIFQTRGFDALDAAIWATILLLVLTGVTGLVVAPFIFFGYGFDLFESIFTHPKKIADLQQKIDEIKQEIGEIEGTNKEETLGESNDGLSQPKKRSKLDILKEREKILSEQKELCEQHRNLNIGLSAGFVINAGVYLGLQTCLKFGLLVALSAVAPPLTIAVLSVAIIGSIASIAYYFCVKKPREEEFAKRLAGLEAQEKELERELKELEEPKHSLALAEQAVLQSPQKEKNSVAQESEEQLKSPPASPHLMQKCVTPAYFKPSQSLVRRPLINKYSQIELDKNISEVVSSNAGSEEIPNPPPTASPIDKSLSSAAP